MCTLTVFGHPGQLIITMNRDEQRDRTESGILQQYQAGAHTIAYPVDDRSGGTWLGISSHGLCLCLTNRYEAATPASSGVRQSRGSLIPHLLEAGDVAAVHDAVLQTDFTPYPAFDLFLFSLSESRHFCWQAGRLSRLDTQIDPAFLHVSSARHQRVTWQYRQACFRAFRQRYVSSAPVPASAIIRDLHQHQSATRPGQSVLMDRGDARTQSITQVVLGPDDLQLDYHPRAPDGTFFPVGRLLLSPLIPPQSSTEGLT